MNELAIAPMQELAKTLSVSALIPPLLHGKTPDVLAVILTGQELGLGPMQSLRSIQIIKGKPTLSADLMGALCRQRRDICEYIRLVESTAKVARYETKRAGDSSPTPMSFSIEQAKNAGLSGDNWQKYPEAMLRARALSALCRAVYPDLILGLYDPDELGGVQAATPAAPTPVRATASPQVSAIKESLNRTLGVTDAEIRPMAPPVPSEPEGINDSLQFSPPPHDLQEEEPPKRNPNTPPSRGASGVTAWYDDKKKHRFKKGQPIEDISVDGLEFLMWILENGTPNPQYAALDAQRKSAISAEMARRGAQ